jgi:hypothetical protein
MALVAVLNALQKGMGTMQIARRELGVRPWAESDHHHGTTNEQCQRSAHNVNQDIQP